MESFEIQVQIEGLPENLLICPIADENKYNVFDREEYIGTVYQDTDKNNNRIWCADGLMVRELLDRIGEQIDAYTSQG